MTQPESTMRAVLLHPPGRIADLHLEQVDAPKPASDEVIVEAHAAGITRDELEWPVDRLPVIPSYEVSGTIASVGEEISGFSVGDNVFGLTGFDRDGCAADFLAVPTNRLAPKPATLDHVESAAMPLAGLSALQGLFDHGKLEKDQRVVIHGGGGGVGVYAVQLAHLAGAYVIATTSRERIDTAQRLGADEVIDTGVTDSATIDPVHLVFDTGGGDRLLRSVSIIKPGGRLVSVAAEPPLELCAERGIDGVYFVVEPNGAQLRQLVRHVDAGDLHAVVDRTYPLTDIQEAFRRVQERTGHGKVVLTVGGAP